MAIMSVMTSAAPLHVIPTPLGKWHVQREGELRPLSEHDNATEAENKARDAGSGEILIHDRYDRVHRVRAELETSAAG